MERNWTRSWKETEQERKVSGQSEIFFGSTQEGFSLPFLLEHHTQKA